MSFFFFVPELLKMKSYTYLFSASAAAAGCSLIERSVVKSQAAAALRSVLGRDAKLLSKNVQLLPLVLVTRTCLNGREKRRKKGSFPAFQLPPQVQLADGMQKWKREHRGGILQGVQPAHTDCCGPVLSDY